MAEEFARKQFLGQRGAIDGKERHALPPAREMDDLCEEAFAHARLTGQQHVAVRVLHPVDGAEDVVHARAPGDDRDLFVHARIGLQRDVLLLQDFLIADLIHLQDQFVQVERLGNILDGALFHRLDGRTDAAEARDDDHLDLDLFHLDLFEQFNAREPRHLDVRDQEVKGIRLDLREGIEPVQRTRDQVTFSLERVHQVLYGDLFVFGYEYFECHGAPFVSPVVKR